MCRFGITRTCVGPGVDVVERQDGVVLVDDLGGDAPGHDVAEDARPVIAATIRQSTTVCRSRPRTAPGPARAGKPGCCGRSGRSRPCRCGTSSAR